MVGEGGAHRRRLRVDRAGPGALVRSGGRRKGRGFSWRWLILTALGFGTLGLWALIFPRRNGLEPADGGGTPAVDARLPLDLAADIEISWIPAPAGSLRLAERHPGAEVAVVFVHGLGGALEQWAPLLAALGPAVHGVAVDLPGHGGSDAGVDGATVAGATAAIGAVIDGLGLRRPVLVAHSLGAGAALAYAGQHPGRVAGVLLVDPSGDQTRVPQADRESELARVRRDPAGELEWHFRQLLTDAGPEVSTRVLAQLRATSAEVLYQLFASAFTFSPLPALERYGGEVRALVSDLNALPYSLHRLAPELPFRRMSRASHWLMLDRADDVWAELVDFLDELRRRSLL